MEIELNLKEVVDLRNEIIDLLIRNLGFDVKYDLRKNLDELEKPFERATKSRNEIILEYGKAKEEAGPVSLKPEHENFERGMTELSKLMKKEERVTLVEFVLEDFIDPDTGKFINSKVPFKVIYKLIKDKVKEIDTVEVEETK